MVLKPLISWYRRYHQQLRHFIFHNILHVDDPPHSLALGLAIGVFLAFTPTVGIQMVLAGIITWILGANKAVSVTVVWISNPATLVPIYWSGYRVGCLMLGIEPEGAEWWGELTTPPTGWWNAVKFYWVEFLEISKPLWLGSFVVGGVFGLLTYYGSFHLIRGYRARRDALPDKQEAADTENQE